MTVKLGMYQTLSVITGGMLAVAVLNSWLEYQSNRLGPSTTDAMKIAFFIFLPLYFSLRRIYQIKRAEKLKPQTKRTAKPS